MSYAEIYQANLPTLKEPLEIDLGEQRITFQRGPLSFSYSVPVKSFGAGAASLRLGQRKVSLPAGSYCRIEALIKEMTGSERERVALLVTEAATLITLRSPSLLDEKLFEGVVAPPGAQIIWPEGPITLTVAPSLEPETIMADFKDDLTKIQELSSEDRSRLQLASRWFRRGNEALNPVDRFLFWWTVLEVYPAKARTKVVNYTIDLIKERVYPHKDRQDVKSMLEIGQMSSARDRIVHSGQAFVEDSERKVFDERLKKLRATTTVCLRLLAGIPHGDDLDQFMRTEP